MCDVCGHEWITRVSGRTTACRICNAPIYVSGTRAATPLSARPTRLIYCRCGKSMRTRREPRTTTPCSGCGARIWIPDSAQIVVPAPTRTSPRPAPRTPRPTNAPPPRMPYPPVQVPAQATRAPSRPVPPTIRPVARQGPTAGGLTKIYGYRIDPAWRSRPRECGLTTKRGAPCRTPAHGVVMGLPVCEAHHGGMARAAASGQQP